MINLNSVQKLLKKNGFVLSNIIKNNDGSKEEDYIRDNSICSLSIDYCGGVTKITMVEDFLNSDKKWERKTQTETNLVDAIKKFGWNTK